MMVLESSKTYSFLGTKMKYNKMQMLSDTEHRWKCFITTTYGERKAQGTRFLRPWLKAPKQSLQYLVIWQKKVGGGVFIIFFMGPRWTSWQPCLWLRIHFKIVNHNKWKLRCVTVLDFNMFRVLLSLHLQSFLHGACHFIITFDSAASPFVFTSSDVSPSPPCVLTTTQIG